MNIVQFKIFANSMKSAYPELSAKFDEVLDTLDSNVDSGSSEYVEIKIAMDALGEVIRSNENVKRSRGRYI